jgi:pantetheine-phosphate adenylyltransferase
VIICGVRDRTDLPYEYQLAAMNEALGVTTLLLPAQSELAATSSTILRKLGAWATSGLAATPPAARVAAG